MANCCRTRSGGKAGLRYPFAQEVCRKAAKTDSRWSEIRAPTRSSNAYSTNGLQRCAVTTQYAVAANGRQRVALEYTNERIRCARGCRTVPVYTRGKKEPAIFFLIAGRFDQCGVTTSSRSLHLQTSSCYPARRKRSLHAVAAFRAHPSRCGLRQPR